MVVRRSGKIVNLGSQAGFVALPTESVYCMTKAAIAHLTKCLAVEWGEHGITVNAVAPTFIRTPGTANACKRCVSHRALGDIVWLCRRHGRRDGRHCLFSVASRRDDHRGNIAHRRRVLGPLTSRHLQQRGYFSRSSSSPEVHPRDVLALAFEVLGDAPGELRSTRWCTL